MKFVPKNIWVKKMKSSAQKEKGEKEKDVTNARALLYI